MRLRGVATLTLVLGLLTAAGAVRAPAQERNPFGAEDFTTIIKDAQDQGGYLDIREVAVGQSPDGTVVFRWTVTGDPTEPVPGSYMEIHFETPRGSYYVAVSSAGTPWASADSPAGFDECTFEDDGIYCRMSLSALGVGPGDHITATWADSWCCVAAGSYVDVAPGTDVTRFAEELFGDDYVIKNLDGPPVLSLSTDRTDLTMHAGSSLDTRLVLANDGDQTTPIAWNVTAPTDLNVDLDPYKEEIPPWETHDVPTTIRTGSDVAPGRYNVTIQVVGEDTSDRVQLTVDVPDTSPDGPPMEVRLPDEPVAIRPGTSVASDVTVRNLHDQGRDVQLTAKAPDGIEAALHDPQGHVPAGGQMTTTATFTADAEAFTGPANVTLHVADATGWNTTVDVPVEVRPVPTNAETQVPPDPGATLPAPSPLAVLATLGAAVAAASVARRD